MGNKAVQYLRYSQFSFFGSLLVCFLLVPKVITGNLGISYYGNHALTIVPYVVGLLLTSYFIIKAAHTLPHTNHDLNILADVLVVMALLIVGVLLTPYSIDTLFDRAHIVTSAILFMVELSLAIWLVAMTYKDWVNVSLLAVQVVGAVIAMISLLPNIELMLTGQVITQLAFGILLIRTIGKLIRVSE